MPGADRRTSENPIGPRRSEAESEARLRAIVDNAVDGIITIDEFGTIADVNPAAQRLFGYSAEELVGQNVRVLMPEPYRTEHDGYLRNYRETGRPKIIGIGREVSGRRKNGSVFPLELSVSEVHFGGRRLFTGIVRDVTERKRVEEERQKFVSLVENSSDAIAMASLSWQLIYFNKSGQRLIGVPPDKVETMEVRDLWHESSLPSLFEKALPAQLKGESHRFQGQVKHFTTGETIDVDCNTFGIRDPQSGNILAIAFSLRDIREQKRAEQALRDSEAHMKAILDSAVDGILTINERGIIETVNPTAETIFGYTREELIGQNVKILMPEPYRSEHDQYLRNYRHTGVRKIIGIGREVVGRRKDGTVFPIDLSVSEVELGDRPLFTGIIRDITERAEAERHRDLLLAELSHRVKNTLATVSSVAQQSFGKGQSFEEGRRSFEGRLQVLAKTHSRLAEANWTGASLRVVVVDELAAYRNEDGKNICITGPDVLLVPKNALTVGMAIHELATNAAKYGALSVPSGSVAVEWRVGGRKGRERLDLTWKEVGGPPVKEVTRTGFGRMLLERGLALELEGDVDLLFEEQGVNCEISFPLGFSKNSASERASEIW